MLDYSALSALAAVIREGSFERAARTLHVTPSAISQRIRLLEERVGCALVVRGQPCRATDTGRRLCQHIDRVRLLEQELQGTLPALAPEGIARVPLPVAVNADSLATWFAPAIATFAAQAPVLMEVAVDDETHTAEWLRSGAVLAAVTATVQQAVQGVGEEGQRGFTQRVVQRAGQHVQQPLRAVGGRRWQRRGGTRDGGRAFARWTWSWLLFLAAGFAARESQAAARSGNDGLSLAIMATRPPGDKN